MKKYMSFFFLSLLLLCGYAKAQEQSYIHAKGHACEEIKKDESKSAARTRVADKASFDAVENLDIIQQYKNDFNEHDFNVMIYALVDSVLEGVAVQTTSEDETKVCVEVNAMADEIKLRSELGEYLKERAERTPTDVVVETVNEAIEKKETKPLAVIQTEPENRALVFVSPTIFYNGASSDNHSKLIKHYLGNNDNFYITENEDIADFVLYPRVEKARIDEAQDGTKRLQMQTIFTLVSSEGDSVAKDEQSRAIICDENKTEQQNAQELLKKMFSKSAKRISVEIVKFKKMK